MSVTCAAILCVRNEAMHIQRAVNDFINQGIDVVVIDHGSTDNTLSICDNFKGHGLLKIEPLPWTGVFDLTHQLEAKHKIAATLDHDWIIHADADEWLQSPVQSETLLEGINRISASGCNVINFEEFVFLPFEGQEFNHKDYRKQILSYYYFAPDKLRLMRAWNRSSNFRNAKTGGHKLSGPDINVASESFILKHYLVISHEHAVQKYIGRVFSEQDLSKNWHRNRFNLVTEKLALPELVQLKMLARWDNASLDKSAPKKTHYWEWS